MKRFITICLLLAGLTTSAQTFSRKAVLTKGQRFELATTLDGEFEMSAMGQTEKMWNRSTRIKAIAVEKVLDTTYQLSSKLIKKTRKSQSSSENFDFDSEKPRDS